MASCLIAGQFSVFAAPETIPLPEHPRPDFERAAWLNLNGPWQFRFDKDDAGLNAKWFESKETFPQTIVVPFPWGAPLSKLADEAPIGWYARTLRAPENWQGQRVFLVIGAWPIFGFLGGEWLLFWFLFRKHHRGEDRVLDAVLDQVPATPQRRAGWLARRFPPMNTYARVGVIAATVLAIAVIGIGLLGRFANVGPPVPTPSLVVSPSPVANPLAGTWLAPDATCTQQIATIEAAGYTAEQMTSAGFDPIPFIKIVHPPEAFTLSVRGAAG